MDKITRHHHIIQLLQHAQTTPNPSADSAATDDKLVAASSPSSSVAPLFSTRALAKHLGVSEMTVRRDLLELAQEGLLQRRHGGAAPAIRVNQPARKEIGILLVSRTGKYTDPFFSAVLEGIDTRLQALGYRIAYINSQEAVRTAEQVRDMLEAHPISGVILIGPPISAEGVEYLKSNVRALVQTVDAASPDHDTVTFDGYRGIRHIVDHLVGRGYRRLGFITGKFDARYTGFLAGIQAHGLPDDPALALEIPFGLEGWTPDIGYNGAQGLMKLPTPPDAIVCASDRIAIGVIHWLHQHGYRIPEDVAVTGFDNIVESAFTVPALTTVHVHKQLIGEIAAERAVKRIEHANDIPLFIQTPTHLVIRQSS